MAKLVASSDAPIAYHPVFVDVDLDPDQIALCETGINPQDEPDLESQISWFRPARPSLKPWATRFSLRTVKVSL
ncbi:MAG: hypothetical protein JWN25_992 [Verrucomicrobiales bacterium]|nr:hypothetical protein [Verrucomicrobiales bacterium]MDB6130172.1 hypothetical protein [Verrucomicrobiales bacterium]